MSAASHAPVQSYWALAYRDFKRNRLALAALAIVFFIITVAVHCPLIANQRPLYLSASLPDDFENEAFIALEEIGRVERALAGDAARDRENALASLDVRIDLMSDHLAEEDARALRELKGKLEAATTAEELAPLRDAFEERYIDSTPPLGPIERYPALRALTAWEIFFIIFYWSLLGMLLLAKLSPSFRGLGKVLFPAVALATAVTGAVRGLTLSVPLTDGPGLVLYRGLKPEIIDTRPYRRITTAPGFEGRVVRTPIPFGENENIIENAREAPRLTKPMLGRGLPIEEAAETLADLGNGPMEELARLAQDPGLRLSIAAEKRRILLSQMERTLQAMRSDLSAENHARLAALVARLRGEPPESAAFREALAELRRDRETLLALRENPHWLGTDTNGRDVLARVVYGARVSMLIGMLSVAIYSTIGIILGALAGFYRGWVDIVISRVIEVVICFPFLITILAVQSFLRQSILNIILTLSFFAWTSVARLQRGEFLRLANLDYVQAMRALGATNTRIIFRHILPNALGPILVLVSFGIPASILTESTLSYLGFGVPQPMASWGDLMNNGRSDPRGLWWLAFFPGLILFGTLTCFNLLGEAVRDVLDPRRD